MHLCRRPSIFLPLSIQGMNNMLCFSHIIFIQCKDHLIVINLGDRISEVCIAALLFSEKLRASYIINCLRDGSRYGRCKVRICG